MTDLIWLLFDCEQEQRVREAVERLGEIAEGGK